MHGKMTILPFREALINAERHWKELYAFHQRAGLEESDGS